MTYLDHFLSSVRDKLVIYSPGDTLHKVALRDGFVFHTYMPDAPVEMVGLTNEGWEQVSKPIE